MSHTITIDDMTFARSHADRVRPNDSDVESAAMAGLLLASETYDGRGSWRGFAGQRIRWAIVDELRRTRPDPIDVTTLPDATTTFGPTCLDDRTADLCAALHVELRAARCEFLLDGVDRRRMADRGALVHLRRVLS
ncbi:hypothetical protein [Demequina capsici]|uniref:Uncharacterized protein n=1 Tax=Demequina capsici TaxID=3075620 RepID=A0AA96FBI2_9MICO|nr:hypothetical protein [Demequina sp. OYTSA14]WNM25235.1 hypothetical protein RN606_03550 [Demequina sp. OYTSA14]